MKRIPLSAWVLLAGLLVGVGQIVFMGPFLPERVASHFGPSGQVDGWMPRSAFLQMQAVILVFVVGNFTLIPTFIARTPPEMINLPNKDYWLAPERRATTFAIINSQMLAFGAATIALMVSVFQSVYEANIKGTFQLGNTIWLILAGYLIYTIIWVVVLHRRFALPRS